MMNREWPRFGWFLALTLAACNGGGSTPAPTGGVGPGDPPETADRLGLFAVAASYVSLEGAADEGANLEFIVAESERAWGGPIPVTGDFDGDGFDTVGEYMAVEGAFYLRNENAGGPFDLTISLGQPGGSFPLAGDFNGDGVDTVGVYAPATGTFTLFESNVEGAPSSTFTFGPVNSFPVAGDFDGDGKDEVGVYDLAAGQFVLRGVGEGGADVEVPFSEAGGAPIYPFIGDFDGDKIDDLAYSALTTSTIHWRPIAPGEGGTFERKSRAFARVPMAGRWKPGKAAGARTGFAWPPSTPSAEGISEASLAAAFEHARGLPYIHSLLVVRHGKLVAEEYFNDYRADYPQCIKSVSKSVLSALYGIAFERGDLQSPEATVASLLPEYFPTGVDPMKLDIKLKHLLTMSGGLSWEEDGPPFKEFVASEDMVGYALGRDVISPPGAAYLYNTGLTHTAAEILTRESGRPLNEYAREHLFEPLGIEVQRWDHAANGTFFGGSEVWMPPRDMARFGELYLRDGSLDGKALVTKEWIGGTTANLFDGYGGLWWVDEFAGHPTFFAWGYGGQFIFIVRELDLVVVITSDWTLGAEKEESYANAFALLEERVLPAVQP
jgi:CubicO group peptidase (beta-lactamase class C family)